MWRLIVYNTTFNILNILAWLKPCISCGFKFSFVFSLSEYSDENMMDPYNLAICFGPTLIPIPPDRDQVTFQTNVNEVIKTIIRNQDEILPSDGGELYEKCMVEMR